MLEPNSSAELDDALQASGGAGFWLGADHSTGRWVGTVSSCPPVFRWADPPEFGNGDCPFMDVGGAVVTACGGTAAATVCERRP